jgi:endoglucanase
MLPVVTLSLTTGQARAQGVGYWHTSGAQILDSENKPVRIAGVNWYGFETTDAVVHGLYSQDYKTILNTIAAQGYNTIRLPFSNQMIESPGVPTISFSNAAGPINGDLKGANSLQIMDKVIAEAGKLGLKVILDNHRSEAGNSNEESGLWYTSAYPEAKWIADWKTLAERYANAKDANGNPTVIGVDLRNEPHLVGTNGSLTGSCWTGDPSAKGCAVTDTVQNWPAAAGRAANAILAVNPSLLIFVEGTDCYGGDCGWQGANLEGAGKYPVTVKVANRLVYSAHDYGPDLFPQTWFNSKTTPGSLAATWTKYWAYLSTDGTAPVWIGEFGTTNATADVEASAAGSQGQWFESLVSYLGSHPNLQWTYWALNGEDSFALLNTTYGETPVNSVKQQKLESIQFVLDGGPIKPATCEAAPAVPVGLTVLATSSTAITLSWSAGTQPANCGLTYNLYRSTVSSFSAQASNLIASGLTATKWADGGLTPATNYYYKVIATDMIGNSAATAAAGATTQKIIAAKGAGCHVAYSITSSWSGGFQTAITISNTGTTSVSNWTLTWNFSGNQQIASAWNASETQTGSAVTLKNLSYNGAIAPGANVTGMGFTASVTGNNGAPAVLKLNGVTCQ